MGRSTDTRVGGPAFRLFYRFPFRNCGCPAGCPMLLISRDATTTLGAHFAQFAKGGYPTADSNAFDLQILRYLFSEGNLSPSFIHLHEPGFTE